MSGASAASSAASTLGLECCSRCQRQGTRAHMAKQRFARGRRACGTAGHYQRGRSRGIACRIRYMEQLWASAAGAGSASITYLPAKI